MLTERQAHGLLHQAADTIDVTDLATSGPLDTTLAPRRRWPLVAAAAAAAVIVVVVGGTLAVVNGSNDDAAPSTPPTAPAEVRIPSVLGYNTTEAVAMLEGLGLEVKVQRLAAQCPDDDQALGTVPTTEGVVPSGGTVTVRSPAQNFRGECPSPPPEQEAATRLIRFARDLGPAPRLARTVTIITGDGSVELSGTQVSDPEQWVVCANGSCRSPLKALLERADEPDFYDYRKISPGLTTVTSRSEKHGCSGHVAAGAATAIDVQGAYDGPVVPCGVIDVYLDQQGRITTVDLTNDELGAVAADRASPTAEVPYLMGMDSDNARTALQDAGFAVQVRKVARPCDDGGVVMSQHPIGGANATAGSTVRIAVNRRDPGRSICRALPERGVGSAFLAFADGLGDAPTTLFANDVTLAVDGEVIRTLDEGSAAKRGSWVDDDACRGPAGACFVFDRLQFLADGAAMAGLPDGCAGRPAGLPTSPRPAEEGSFTTEYVSLSNDGRCGHAAVVAAILVDDESRAIVAVNLAQPDAVVPNVIGLGISAATRRIQTAGLTSDGPILGCSIVGTIGTQQPPAGATRLAGDRVVLTCG